MAAVASSRWMLHTDGGWGDSPLSCKSSLSTQKSAILNIKNSELLLNYSVSFQSHCLKKRSRCLRPLLHLWGWRIPPSGLCEGQIGVDEGTVMRKLGEEECRLPQGGLMEGEGDILGHECVFSNWRVAVWESACLREACMCVRMGVGANQQREQLVWKQGKEDWQYV